GDDQLYYFCDSTIITCTTIPSKLIAKAVFSWIQPRSNGEIWCFGTPASTRFQRYKIPAFQKLDTIDLPNSTLTATLELRDGTLIGSTDKSGIYVYNGEKWQVVEGSPNESGLKPRFEDQEGNVWFSGNGVKVWNPITNSWTSYNMSNSDLTVGNTTDIIGDAYGNIIITADCFFSTDTSLVRGIFVKKGSTWTRYDTTNTGMPSVDVLCLARDSSGNIWFGSRSGVFKWDGKSKWEYMCKGAINIHQPFGFIRAITVDAKNRVWVAGFHVGFFMFDQNGSGCIPIIRVAYPTCGAVVKQKGICVITWAYEGPVGAVKIELREGYKAWNTITDKIDNNRMYSWYTGTLPLNTSYQIRVSSIDNPAVFDTSARFTIADSGVNIPPELISFPDTFEVKTNQKATFTIHAKDVDNDTLRYSYLSLPDWVTSKDSVVTFEPKTSSQSFTLFISVSDSKGGTVNDSMVVVVSIPTGSIKNSTLKCGKYLLSRNRSGELDLQLLNNTITATASVYNLCGRKVGEFKNKNDHITINYTNGLPEGTMFLLVVDILSETGRTRMIQKVILP
ncbi:MAG TPA: two-component regulator propeller domain-containing protein, partial [Chitinispirillaceae bacterium]|nr:two-component regulator propeller domain-containing protein [Chitinispirillaceae bacterium]